MAQLRTDDELREELKRFRGAQAHRKQCEPYRIFTNAILEVLVEQKPSTLQSLSMVKGFGEKRIAAYGQGIIDIINKSNMKKSSSF